MRCFSYSSASARSPAFLAALTVEKNSADCATALECPARYISHFQGLGGLPLILITTEKSLHLSGMKYMQVNIKRTGRVRE